MYENVAEYFLSTPLNLFRWINKNYGAQYFYSENLYIFHKLILSEI